MILGAISKQPFLAQCKTFTDTSKKEKAAQCVIYFYYPSNRFDFLSGFSVTK